MEVFVSVLEVQKILFDVIDSIFGEIFIDFRRKILDKVFDDLLKIMGLKKNL